MKKFIFKPIVKDFSSEPDLVYNDVKHVVETNTDWFLFRDQVPNIWRIKKSVYYQAQVTP